MWRYQGIYELMKKDDRFHVNIILVPFKDFSQEQQTNSISKLRSYFDKINISYIDSTLGNFLIEDLQPDIMFYVQPYGSEYISKYNSLNFTDRLLCYLPYGVGTVHTEWTLNTRFLNLAYRLFYDTAVFRDEARKYCYNRGKNVEIVGNVNSDRFLNAEHEDVWKPQDKAKKKIIWAPHFSIEKEFELHRGSFLWLYDVMLQIATDYKQKVQIAFKPHPRLKSVLYDFPEWGKERTDRYYELWNEMENTQLEEGDFVDLFMTSDAMIHDSGSFIVEYHYSLKPVLFTTKVWQENISILNDFGKQALSVHYIADSCKGVRDFIDNIVLKGVDPMYIKRKNFFDSHLLPPIGKTVASNVLNNIIGAIWQQA